MVLSNSDSKVAACMLRDHEIFAYAARTWTCAPTMKEFEALKVHLDKLYLDGKLGFPGGRMKRARDISDLWKIIDTEEHRRKVGEMTAVAKFVLEAAGVSIIDVPQEKEPGLVSSIAKVRAPSAFIFPDCFGTGARTVGRPANRFVKKQNVRAACVAACHLASQRVTVILPARLVCNVIFRSPAKRMLFDDAVWWLADAEGEGPDLQGRPRSQVSVQPQAVQHAEDCSGPRAELQGAERNGKEVEKLRAELPAREREKGQPRCILPSFL
jgi:hypothetical protein